MNSKQRRRKHRQLLRMADAWNKLTEEMCNDLYAGLTLMLVGIFNENHALLIIGLCFLIIGDDK